MDLQYKKLLDVIVRNDYYLKGLDKDNNSIWPIDYNILNDLEFIPTLESIEILKNHQVVYKPCSTGFKLYARAIQSEIPATANEFKSFIYLPPDLKLTFLICIKKTFFSNYTNLRLPGSEKYLYYFSNQSGHLHNGFPFLTSEMMTYNHLPSGENHYQWGDMIRRGSKILEAKQIIDPATSFNLNNWVTNDINDARYVTVHDRISWQNPDFIYDSSNDHPGETIRFELTSIDGSTMPLGNIPDTDMPQDTFKAPVDSKYPVHYKLDLGHVPSGIYTLKIHKTTPEPDRIFYLLDPMMYYGTFGVIELYTTSNQNMNFVMYLQNDKNKEAVIQEKSFQIRFNNRLTTWKYIFPDENEIVVDAPRGLSRFPTEFRYNGNGTILPDPDINLIDPVRNTAYPELIENIYSEIFLNEQYKTN